ncbi:MAG: HlyC/CorC family transporter [Alphaproteobacteria bacterium]|nr:HlyC/CorC family transporter [Alphaproteobacteria bacterium]
MSLLEKIKTSRRLKEAEDKVFETLEEIIDEREERGDDHLVDARELPMLKNLFRLRDIRVYDVMTPRVDIDALDIKMTSQQFCKYIQKEKFSRYPVYDGSLDNIVGIIHVKDILFALINKEKCTVSKLMKPGVLFVSPAMRALDLLKVMQSKQIQLAIVIDEHGGVDGLIALEDILEVVVGEIDDEHDEPEDDMIKRIDDTSLEVNAKARLADLEEMIGPVATEEERENPDIDTIGGWVVHLAGRMPSKGEVVHHSQTGIRFLIQSSNPSHIERLKIMSIPSKEVLQEIALRQEEEENEE